MREHQHDDEVHIQEQPAATYLERRAQAVMSILIDKEVVTPDEIRHAIDDMDSMTPALGAKVVARAWVDSEFKSRLLSNANVALEEMGIDIGSVNTLVALENTDNVHNVVVCTLCSCYPRAILGVPPAWYKSLEYRSRAVIDPRGVLQEFGLELDQDIEVRVYDSTADIRYLVIPARPAGTEHLTEEALAALVTRDSMIGVAQARDPD